VLNGGLTRIRGSSTGIVGSAMSLSGEPVLFGKFLILGLKFSPGLRVGL
jgi:hypothetical protein